MACKIPCLKTERLTLRNISLEDTEYIVAWRSDPEVYCYFLTPHSIKAEEHINWFIDRYLYDDNRFDWMAVDGKDELVGVFGIRRDCEESLEAEINYILAPEKRGFGYAREAVLKLIEYASQAWNVKKIIAEIHVDNLESIKFANNIGMALSCTQGNFGIFEMIVGV